MAEIVIGREERIQMKTSLQKKKNKLRKELSSKGILKRGGENKYDGYSYFSESQYKELFTELFSKYGLELNVSELDYIAFEGTQKMPHGRLAKMQFTLIDIETGASEESVITGEGMDKGDKAGYKAYTGALKYYLANTFLVATGDDIEKHSQEDETEKSAPRKASENQVAFLRKYYTGESLEKLLELNNIKAIEEITLSRASELIGEIKKRGEANGNN